MSAPFRIKRFQKLTTKGGAPAPGDLAAPALQPTTKENIQQYMENLIKLIPAEVITLYLAGKGILESSKIEALKEIWPLICLVFVIIIRIWGTKDTDTPVQWPAVVISAISFVIWVYAVGENFFGQPLPDPVIATMLVLAWTFIVPKIYKGN